MSRGVRSPAGLEQKPGTPFGFVDAPRVRLTAGAAEDEREDDIEVFILAKIVALENGQTA